MGKFTFYRGVWEEGNPLKPVLGRDMLYEELDRMGYVRSMTYGNQKEAHIEICRGTDESFFALVFLDDVSIVNKVFLPDFPSMMDFIKDYAIAFASGKSSNDAASRDLRY